MTQYLILHKVRGEPSFDCAEEIEPDMWITNSGYRAYPYMKWSLDKLLDVTEVDIPGVLSQRRDWPSMNLTVPADWPDHFEIRNEAKPAANFNIMQAISNLLPKVRRRV